ITVIDGIPPTPVCRQVTRVGLSSDLSGYTEVLAKYFDEGSYDNCGPVYFKVVKMNENVCDNFIASQEWFDDKVSFCCSDIRYDANGNQIPVMVVLRVYDTDPGVGRIPTARIPNNPTNLTHTGAASSLNNNRYNDCMIEVYIDDKLRPSCTAPKDIWATCDTIPANTDLSDTTTLQRLFGNALTTDNCSSWTRELAPDVDVDICGVGTVTRRWVATDVSRNTSVGLCRQIIQIMPRNLYRIDVPDDFEGECRDVAASGLTASGQACDLLAISHKDDTLVAALPFCYKVIRTWKIINWCEYNGFDDPTILPRVNTDPDLLFDRYTVWSNGDYLYVGASINDPTNRIVNVSSHRGPFLAKNPANTAGVSNGYYEYEQHIKVYDNRAPVLTDTLSGPFCGGERDEDPCTGLVNLLPQIVEDCGQVDLTRVTWQLDAFSSTFVTADFSGTNRLNARYPLGTHTVRFRVPDDCGNTSQIDIT